MKQWGGFNHLPPLERLAELIWIGSEGAILFILSMGRLMDSLFAGADGVSSVDPSLDTWGVMELGLPLSSVLLPTKRDHRLGRSADVAQIQVDGIRLSTKGRKEKLVGMGQSDRLDSSKGKGKNILLAKAGDDLLLAGRQDRLKGDAGNDVLDARKGRGKNRLDGGKDHDTLFAKKLDTLLGKAGDDLLDGRDGKAKNVFKGGSGDDQIFAGRRQDTLMGGPGADQLWLATETLPRKPHTVKGFKSGQDVIGFQNVPQVTLFSDLTLEQAGTDTVVQVQGKSVAILKGITASTLTANDFVLEEAMPTTITVDVGLMNDTGASATDGITIDPTIMGTVTDEEGIAGLRAGFGNTPQADFVDISDRLDGNGKFVLNTAQLRTLNGGSLADGAYTLTVVADDGAGNTATEDLSFEVYTSAPEIVEISQRSSQRSSSFLEVTYTQPMGDGAFDVDHYGDLEIGGRSVGIESVERVSDRQVRLNLAESIGEGEYQLSTFSGITDVAGNAFPPGTLVFTITIIIVNG